MIAAAVCATFFLAGSWLLIYCVRGLRQMHREDQHLPAAPDNQAGTNVDDLWICRHIHAATARTDENR